ncbi:MAG: DUF2007 domain-containing protein [Candidatus Binataceae bacterium]|nr:DUF2007 domain-containing protein [Candidatus Binataceae bacterium]
MNDDAQTSSLVEIFAHTDRMQIQIAHDLLESSGVDSFIFDEQGGAILGQYGVIPARLMVYADCAAEARSRLKDLGFVAA